MWWVVLCLKTFDCQAHEIMQELHPAATLRARFDSVAQIWQSKVLRHRTTHHIGCSGRVQQNYLEIGVFSIKWPKIKKHDFEISYTI